MNGKQALGVAVAAGLVEAGVIAGFDNEKFERYVGTHSANAKPWAQDLLRGILAPGWMLKAHGETKAWTAEIVGNALLVVLVAVFAAMLGRGKHDDRGSAGVFFGVWGTTMLAAALALFVRGLIAPAAQAGYVSGDARMTAGVENAIGGGAAHGLLVGWLPALAALIVAMAVRSSAPYAAGYPGYYGPTPPANYYGATGYGQPTYTSASSTSLAGPPAGYPDSTAAPPSGNREPVAAPEPQRPESAAPRAHSEPAELPPRAPQPEQPRDDVTRPIPRITEQRPDSSETAPISNPDAGAQPPADPATEPVSPPPESGSADSGSQDNRPSADRPIEP